MFGNLDWRVSETLLVNLDGMLEQSDLVGDTLSSCIGINYAFNRNHILRVAASRVYKYPSLLEDNWLTLLCLDDSTPFYLYMQSNGDLNPERRDALELAYLARWMDDRLNLRLVKAYRWRKADAKIELIEQNLGADSNEFTFENNFETRLLARAGIQFH